MFDDFDVFYTGYAHLDFVSIIFTIRDTLPIFSGQRSKNPNIKEGIHTLIDVSFKSIPCGFALRMKILIREYEILGMSKDDMKENIQNCLFKSAANCNTSIADQVHYFMFNSPEFMYYIDYDSCMLLILFS